MSQEQIDAQVAEWTTRGVMFAPVLVMVAFCFLLACIL